MLSSKLQRAKVAFNTCLIPRSGRRGASVTAHDDYTDVRCTCHWHGSHDQCERMTAKFDARSVDLNSGTSLAPVVAVQCKTRIAIFYNGGNGVGDGRREDGQAKLKCPHHHPPACGDSACDPVCSFPPWPEPRAGSKAARVTTSSPVLGQNTAPVQKLRV